MAVAFLDVVRPAVLEAGLVVALGWVALGSSFASLEVAVRVLAAAFSSSSTASAVSGRKLALQVSSRSSS
ncbi:MAG: hypothetical protein KatS3mg011_0300 [Acidimicrobiia bacterium]|nr:MAG: hypothetical protein KatS3mg011_0300 [Acidimicrobiia bacterium]